MGRLNKYSFPRPTVGTTNFPPLLVLVFDIRPSSHWLMRGIGASCFSGNTGNNLSHGRRLPSFFTCGAGQINTLVVDFRIDERLGARSPPKIGSIGAQEAGELLTNIARTYKVSHITSI
jgi:hypothetical protein